MFSVPKSSSVMFTEVVPIETKRMVHVQNMAKREEGGPGWGWFHLHWGRGGLCTLLWHDVVLRRASGVTHVVYLTYFTSSSFSIRFVLLCFIKQTVKGGKERVPAWHQQCIQTHTYIHHR